MWYCNSFKTEGYDIVMAGDFNLTEEYLRLNTEGYQISRNAGATRNTRNANTAIDHVMSTFKMSREEQI